MRSPELLQVRLTDDGGLPVAGSTVTWSLVSGVGAPYPLTSVTDANGIAGTSYWGGDLLSVTTAEKYRTSIVRASVPYEPVANFYATTVCSPVGTSGGVADAMPGTQVLDPLGWGVRVTGQAGQTLTGYIRVLVAYYLGATPVTPVPYVGLELRQTYETFYQDPVYASATGGPVLTGADGIATIDVVMGPVVAGGLAALKINITGANPSEPVYWPVYLTSRAAALPQFQFFNWSDMGAIGTLLLPGANTTLPACQVRVHDASGIPAAGVAVLWESVTADALSFVDPDLVTDADGYAQSDVLLGVQPGDYDVRITALGESVLTTIHIVDPGTALAPAVAATPAANAPASAATPISEATPWGGGGGGGALASIRSAAEREAAGKASSVVPRSARKVLDASLLLPPSTNLGSSEGLRALNQRMELIERVLRQPAEYEVNLSAKSGYGKLDAIPATFTPVAGAKVTLDKPGNWQIQATCDWAGSGSAEACVVVDPESAATAKRQDAVMKATAAGTTTAWCLFTAVKAPRLAQLYAKASSGTWTLLEAGTSICAIWVGMWQPGQKVLGRQTESAATGATDIFGDTLTDHGEQAHYPMGDHPDYGASGVEQPDL